MVLFVISTITICAANFLKHPKVCLAYLLYSCCLWLEVLVDVRFTLWKVASQHHLRVLRMDWNRNRSRQAS